VGRQKKTLGRTAAHMLQNIRNSEKNAYSGSIVEEDDYISDSDSDSDDGYSSTVQSETHLTTTGSSIQTQPSEEKEKEMSSRTISRLVAFCQKKKCLGTLSKGMN
jgi:hypothetical protein